jgi:DNA gyrase subunit A
LDPGDELVWARLTHNDTEFLIVTEQGQALRFASDTVRSMGRTAAGVIGIRLEEGDRVASACVVEEGADLLIVTTRGYGKRVALDEFSVKGRYGKGVRCMGGDPERTGKVAAARLVRPEDEVVVMSNEGMILRTPVTDVPRMGRSARGARMIELRRGDLATSVAVLESEKVEG